MRSSLQDARVALTLDRMHSEAERTDPPLLEKAEGKSLAERTAIFGGAFIPVDRDAGRLLYTLVRGCAPGRVVEFGTSFGISTIYMAAAVRDRGGGAVITSEIHESKAERAREYIREAGLTDFVEMRIGDALETLADFARETSFVFLDGWKNLYLPVLRLLEPSLLPGALVVADDIHLFPDALRPYLEYVRDPANGYESVPIPIGDAMELSTRT